MERAGSRARLSTGRATSGSGALRRRERDPDEPDHDELRTLLLETSTSVLTSEVARVELASAAHAAGRAGHVSDWRGLVEAIESDCGAEGPITLLPMRPRRTLDTARRLVLTQRLRTLDAIHLAVALEEGRALAGDDPFVFVTRDGYQAAAAAALGLTVA